MAERMSSALDDTELGLLNLIDRRNKWLAVVRLRRGETGLISLRLHSKPFQRQNDWILPQVYEAEEQDDGALEHQNRRKESSSGFLEKENFMPKQSQNAQERDDGTKQQIEEIRKERKVAEVGFDICSRAGE
jgi:hypothetical protein